MSLDAAHVLDGYESPLSQTVHCWQSGTRPSRRARCTGHPYSRYLRQFQGWATPL